MSIDKKALLCTPRGGEGKSEDDDDDGTTHKEDPDELNGEWVSWCFAGWKIFDGASWAFCGLEITARSVRRQFIDLSSGASVTHMSEIHSHELRRRDNAEGRKVDELDNIKFHKDFP